MRYEIGQKVHNYELELIFIFFIFFIQIKKYITFLTCNTNIATVNVIQSAKYYNLDFFDYCCEIVGFPRNC